MMERTIKVNGQAKASVGPDRIKLQIKIQKLSKEYSEAMHCAEKAQREMSDVIVRAGLDASELKTLSWGITSEYTYYTNEKNEQVREFVGYRYRHSFTVELAMEHKTVGRILSELMQSTLEPEISLWYLVSNPQEYREGLLKQSVEDARKKAELIAEAAGMKLGKPVSIVHSSHGKELLRGGDNQIAVPRMLMAKAVDMPELTPSDEELTEAVTVEWELL